ncbi:MAG TPA: adenine phosphoribosyltransferase [Cyanobacteria bacterium UBA8156]|jgi:adenine phosphoribosyltransferase|nr:adenine phosphoribosyltransferase [Cyanobacteria bacterium UBA8156]
MSVNIQDLIRDVPDFPQPGVIFRDITPVLAHPEGLDTLIEGLSAPFMGIGIALVVGIESRGFILGAPVARQLNCGFVPVRKPGKLPCPTYSVEYALEYGTDRLEMHQDAIAPGQRVLIVDDVIATGGTAGAAAKLIEQAGGKLAGFAFAIELMFLDGRQNLPDNVPVVSLLSYH